MGLYDTFGERAIQLKVGPRELRQFNDGDMIEGVPDGVYVGWGGVVVINNGTVRTFPVLYDNQGGPLDPDKILIQRRTLCPGGEKEGGQ